MNRNEYTQAQLKKVASDAEFMKQYIFALEEEIGEQRADAIYRELLHSRARMAKNKARWEAEQP